jgi:hypothetical protein
MALTVRQGGVTVTLDSGLEKLARTAIEESLPGGLALMEREAAEVADFAYDEWPVESGKSRAGLEMRTVIDVGRSTATVEIRNDVEYAPYIKPKVWHGAYTAWQKLVRGPMTALRKELIDKLGPQIVESIRRARGR